MLKGVCTQQNEQQQELRVVISLCMKKAYGMLAVVLRYPTAYVVGREGSSDSWSKMAQADKSSQKTRAALSEHNYPSPRNILIIPSDMERVAWIDFDVENTYPGSTYIRASERVLKSSLKLKVLSDFGQMLVGGPNISPVALPLTNCIGR
ncbi:hypothetical protein BDDG_07573 [Blastomyces dermatitidis ATCC 18188]|uniref:Uncharacterized protein n=1 Tax=Ajellomyces dermatitidis (strain ATCC 18188 / CBS 674.68) TaxID=653446 RepID=F2TN15_AJEDA|nr:hypothetical protein BDDG_07573 [Blastomyces dermatitidis ATCC 18188]